MTRLLFVFLLITPNCLFSQDSLKTTASIQITPFLFSYSSYQTSLNSDSTWFNQDKLIFGFNASLNKHWSASLGIDMVNFDTKNSRKINGYLKPAKLIYHYKKITVDAGIFILPQYDMQGAFWQNRYVSKVFQDKYGLGNIADLGIHITYHWNEKWNSDFSLTTGKGYKLLNYQTPLKPSFRLIYNPWKSLSFVGYYDFYGGRKRQQALSFTADYHDQKNNSITVEYNSKTNMQFISGLTYKGTSVYGNYHLNNRLGVFFRYDRLLTSMSDTSISTAPNNGGSSVISGLDFHIFKFARFSVNYQNWRADDNLKAAYDWIFLNLEIKY